MTLEEMQSLAAKVVAALACADFDGAEYVKDHEPGAPLPIMFEHDGEYFLLELSPA